MNQNPFTGTFDVHVIRVHKAEKKTIMFEGDLVEIDEYYDIEQDENTKIYSDSDFVMAMQTGCKSVTTKLFFYIMCNLLKENKDHIEIKAKQVCDHLEMSRPSLYTAINELSAMRAITRQTGSLSKYWINPQCLFKGNRVQYIKDKAIDRLKIVARHRQKSVK